MTDQNGPLDSTPPGFGRGVVVSGALLALGLFLAFPSAAEPAHYLVMRTDESGTPRVVSQQTVELAGMPRSLSESELRTLELRHQDTPALGVRLEAADGNMAFRAFVRPERWLRGEFPNAAGDAIEAHHFAQPDPVYVVRVPQVPGGRLRVQGSAPGLASETFVLDPPTSGGTGASLPPPPALAEGGAGSSANRVDLLIMGDGFTAAQEPQFDAAVASFLAGFFSISPYSEYENFVKVTSLFVASSQSGADHPPYNAGCVGDNPSCCADPTMLGDPLANTYVNTAFGARFCAFNIHRLLVINNSAAYTAAAAVPDWGQIVMIVNDTTFGGSGGAISVASTNPSVIDVVRHEFGHVFTQLADEYDLAYPGYPACSDVSNPACEANVTDEVTPSLVKWLPWIGDGVPIPTPEGNPSYANEVGLFEGARYLTSNMYRPRDASCLMLALGQSFCEVCAQEYVLQLYRGGWGVPSAGIDLIEPGSEVPTPGLVNANSVAFEVDVLQPSGGPPVAISWIVDDVEVETGTTSYGFVAPADGSYEVRVEVLDTGSLVHPDMAQNLLGSERDWTVIAVPEPGFTESLVAGCALLAALARRRRQVSE